MAEEEYTGKWQTAPVECPICTHKWVAVWPVITKELECPHCGSIAEPIIRDQDDLRT